MFHTLLILLTVEKLHHSSKILIELFVVNGIHWLAPLGWEQLLGCLWNYNPNLIP